jgi:hypothetical protein
VELVASAYRKLCPKAKDSLIQRRVKKLRRELLESRPIDANLYCPAKRHQPAYRLSARMFPGSRAPDNKQY